MTMVDPHHCRECGVALDICPSCAAYPQDVVEVHLRHANPSISGNPIIKPSESVYFELLTDGVMVHKGPTSWLIPWYGILCLRFGNRGNG